MFRLSLFFSTLLTLLFPVVVPAQEISELVEMTDGVCEESIFPCLPGVPGGSRSMGVGIQYGKIGSQAYGMTKKGAPYRLSFDPQLEAKIKLPFINRPRLKLIAGYTYARYGYDLGPEPESAATYLEDINNEVFKDNRLSLYGLQSVNEWNYVLFRVQLASSGRYRGGFDFDRSALTYGVAALWGYKPALNTEYGLGVMYRRTFFRHSLLPILQLNHTFNERWGFEGVLPVKMLGRYNFKNNKTILLFGGEYNSDSFDGDLRLQNPSGSSAPLYLRVSAIDGKFILQQNIKGWVWASFEGGFQVPTRLELTTEGRQDAFITTNRAVSPYFRVGLFLSP